MIHRLPPANWVRTRTAGLAVVALTALLANLGCAHYGLGASRENSRANDGVTVATVAVPAEFGVDGARLTRELVDALRARGISGAVWGRDDLDSADVRCVVDGPDTTSFEGDHRSRLEARCEVAVPEGIRRVHAVGQQTSAAGRAPREGLSAVENSAVEFAAADAVANAAPKIARLLRDSAPNESQPSAS